MLSVTKLSVRYGAVEAVRDVSFFVKAGEVVTLIGPNGAGKTTTLLALMNILAATGDVTYDGQPLKGKSTESLVAQGLILVPEKRELFADMSVEDNLRLGAYARYRRGDKNLKDDLVQVYDLFPRLQERRRQLAGTMSGGEQQMLAVGRALLTNPKLLILDEATEGLAPVLRAEIWRCVRLLKEERQAILLIDTNLKELLRTADRVYILEKGRIVWRGSAVELSSQPELQQRYLGV